MRPRLSIGPRASTSGSLRECCAQKRLTRSGDPLSDPGGCQGLSYRRRLTLNLSVAAGPASPRKLVPTIDILCLPFFTFVLRGEVQAFAGLRSSWQVNVAVGSFEVNVNLTLAFVLPGLVFTLRFGLFVMFTCGISVGVAPEP